MPVERLPRELVDFLSQRGQALLIKGEAGTGKTMLALECLKTLSDEGKGVYLSSRVSVEKLYTQYPWLKDCVEPEDVIMPERLKFQDIRLGTAEYVLEKLVESAKRLKNGVVVADTWDAVAKELDEVERLKTEKAMLAMVDSSDARIIFVSEEPVRATLDYLVDGVITLTKEEVEGRRIRRLIIDKLRGVRIDNPTYLFTLVGGRFRAFKPHISTIPSKPFTLKPISDPDRYHISSGIETFDRLLGGGYVKGSTNLFEVSDKAGAVYHGLLIPTWINSLKLKSLSIVVPSEGNSIAMIERYLSTPGFDLEELQNFVASFEPDPSRAYIRPLEKTVEESFRSFQTVLYERKKLGGVHGVVYIIGMDTLEYLYGRKAVLKVLGTWVSGIRMQDIVAILVVKEGQKILENLKQICHTHLKVDVIDGSPVVYGIVPKTQTYAFEQTETGVELQPII